ncbi:MAG: AAA family ATPase, partial [Holosporales bacterium]|nr:AAA family ATPase [Holosporales bacterium]
MLYLSGLALNNFRSYRHIEVSFDPSPTVLYGKNGAGKTNLLEAISLFSIGTGMRGAKLKDLCFSSPAASTTEWGANALLSEKVVPEGPADIVLTTGYDNVRRVCKIQGEPVRSAAKFQEYMCIVHITPDLDHIFTNSA